MAFFDYAATVRAISLAPNSDVVDAALGRAVYCGPLPTRAMVLAHLDQRTHARHFAELEADYMRQDDRGMAIFVVEDYVQDWGSIYTTSRGL